MIKRATALLALVLALPSAQAADISVVGLFPGKAVLVVDGAGPRTYEVGSTVAAGVKLVAADQSGATLESRGRREVIALGSHVNRQAPSAQAGTVLQADERGHFFAQGMINGNPVRMLVDTGASLIALPAADAKRMGIDYLRGGRGTVSTANGVVPVYRVRLDTVRIGELELNQVDALVQEQGLPIALLGMSFLNRTDMRRSGEQMTLQRRY
nr:TIGR02281 family clan AA aspartic protease [uncultured Noviherbaspirillum sp.]